EVFVLDMGESMKIHDLARSMIRLMGFSIRDDTNPAGDIEIRITGLRPGEKLYEELLIGDNGTGTQHPMVMQAHGEHLSWSEIAAAVEQFKAALQRDDAQELQALLRSHINGYQTTETIGASAKVIPLKQKSAKEGG